MSNDWDDDPRWREMTSFAEWSSSNADSGEHAEFFERLGRYHAALDSIAADPTAPGDLRELAQGLLDQFAHEARKHTAEALRAAASAADSPNADPVTRAQAQKVLESGLLRLREIIDDPDTPEEIRQQAIKGRQGLLAS
jgi:uncharacterized protein (UPF0147 family)